MSAAKSATKNMITRVSGITQVHVRGDGAMAVAPEEGSGLVVIFCTYPVNHPRKHDIFVNALKRKALTIPQKPLTVLNTAHINHAQPFLYD